MIYFNYCLQFSQLLDLKHKQCICIYIVIKQVVFAIFHILQVWYNVQCVKKHKYKFNCIALKCEWCAITSCKSFSFKDKEKSVLQTISEMWQK